MDSEDRPLCERCRKPLKQGLDGWGYAGDGTFCTRTCGYRFGVEVVAQVRARLGGQARSRLERLLRAGKGGNGTP